MTKIKDLPRDKVLGNKDMRILKGGGSTVFIPMIPDVCKTSTPAGPVPIPYPNVGSSLMGTSTAILISKSYFKPTFVIGPSRGVTTHTISRSIQFSSVSFPDVMLVP